MAKMTFRAPPPTPAAPSLRRRRLARMSEHGHPGTDAPDSGAFFESTWMLRDGLDIEEIRPADPAPPSSEHLGRKVGKP